MGLCPRVTSPWCPGLTHKVDRVGLALSLIGPLKLTWYALVPSLALSSLNKHAEAVAYYKKALELDPENDTYKSNLKIAELKLREAPSPVSSFYKRG